MELLNINASKDGHRLVLALKGRGWVKRRILEREMNLDERQIRAEAEASDARVISGDKGYCLIEEAPFEEADHAAARLISQGDKMRGRGMRIRQRLNNRMLCHP